MVISEEKKPRILKLFLDSDEWKQYELWKSSPSTTREEYRFSVHREKYKCVKFSGDIDYFAAAMIPMRNLTQRARELERENEMLNMDLDSLRIEEKIKKADPKEKFTKELTSLSKLRNKKTAIKNII